MKKLNHYFLFAVAILFGVLSNQSSANAQYLAGYWMNWDDSNAPYIPVNQIDNRYNMVHVAFAIPGGGTDYNMVFTPDQGTVLDFKTRIQSMQAQGKKVLISIGGATAPIKLDNTTERDVFVNTMMNIIN